MDIRVHIQSFFDPKAASEANNSRSTQELILRVRLSPWLSPQRLKIRSNVNSHWVIPRSHP